MLSQKGEGEQRASFPDFRYVYLTRYKIKRHFAMHLIISLLKNVKIYKFIIKDCYSHM